MLNLHLFEMILTNEYYLKKEINMTLIKIITNTFRKTNKKI